MDVFNAARARRSGRDFSEEPLALMELSLLLLASTGITASDGYSFYRASPSAGALYPIETYVVAHRVSELQPGTYHYRHLSQDDEQRLSPKGGHALEQLRRGDMRRQVAEAALDQTIAAEAAAVFTWTAVFERACWKYRERAYRYVYLDAGHIAAQLSLAAVALGLESCPIAAFYDDELNELLGVDGATESSLYLTVVGRPRKP
jgi:SagB-type dehydrogenase family enzyme